MKKQINIKKAIIWGAVAWLIQMVIGNVLWMNPISMEINQRYSGHPTIKDFNFLGGMTNWILVTLAFGTFLITVWILLYLLLYTSIPGKNWVKGLCFGAIIGFIRVVPEAFNQWMLFVYPEPLILLQLINTLVSTILFGIILGFFYFKFRVVTLEPV